MPASLHLSYTGHRSICEAENAHDLTADLAEVTCRDCLREVAAEMDQLRKQVQSLTEAAKQSAFVVRDGGTLVAPKSAAIGFVFIESGGTLKCENGDPALQYGLDRLR